MTWLKPFMAFLRNNSRFLAVFTAVSGVLYPFIVYMLLGKVPASLFVLLGFGLILCRITVIRNSPLAGQLLPSLIIMAISIAGLSLMEGEIAAKLYPIVVGLGMALAFGRSLWSPSPLIQTFASFTTPSPSVAARAYMRKVTWVWTVFLLINASLSLITLLYGDIVLWTLYNGLLSYILMGLLFAGEWIIRQRVMRNETPT